MLPDLNLLMQFQAVMDHGSYTGAAGQMHLSRQALTKNIQKMEQMLGGRLFEQRGRTLVPTDLGLTLERHAAPLLLAWRTFVSQMEAELAGEWLALFLSHGTLSALGENPHLVFGQLHREIRISAEVGSCDEVTARVQSGEAQVGILGTVPDYLEGFEYLLLRPSGVWLLCPERHPLALKEELLPQDLLGISICGPGRHNHLQRFVAEGLQRLGIRMNYSMIATYPDKLGQAPEEGIYFGFPPGTASVPEGWRTIHVLLPGEERFGTYAIRRRNSTLPAPAKEFWSFLAGRFAECGHNASF